MPDIYLPILHKGQVAAYKAMVRFFVLRCGRRWGKTAFFIVLACNAAAKGKSVGIFTPDYKIQIELYREIAEILQEVITQHSETKGVIRTSAGGRIDFWTLENPRAGRSRKYHLVIIDEAAFTKPNMIDLWKKAIRPSLMDYKGWAIVGSTPNGIADENFFHWCCTDPKSGFVDFHAPTDSNPYIPPEEIELLRTQHHPLVFRQEVLAEFVDFSGTAFFSEANLTVNGLGAPQPDKCDTVFAVVDSALKDGSENDGTAVVYCALSRFLGYKLIILDWEIVQIQSDLLLTWLPGVFQRCEYFAKECGARNGSMGAFIEDRASGITLNQHALRMGWPAHPIEGGITGAGKDGRAVLASGPVFRGDVKFSAYAYDKVAEYKGISRNHLKHQLCGYRLGDPAAAKRSDDLYDAAVYSIIIALGGDDGF